MSERSSVRTRSPRVLLQTKKNYRTENHPQLTVREAADLKEKEILQKICKFLVFEVHQKRSITLFLSYSLCLQRWVFLIRQEEKIKKMFRKKTMFKHNYYNDDHVRTNVVVLKCHIRYFAKHLSSCTIYA